MAANFYTLFKKKPDSIKDEGTPLTSDQEFLTLPIGSVLIKDGGEEYKKTAVNIFDKSPKKVLSFEEIENNYPEIGGDNSFSGDNSFEGDITVGQTGTFNNIVVKNEANFNNITSNKIDVDNLNVKNSISAPSGTITNLTVTSLNPPSNNSGSIGTSSLRWSTAYINNMYGTSSAAKYSDLAEKYKTDKKYEPGTVLEINKDGILTEFNGGSLAGAIATAPGYRLNSALENGQYVCLKGIIPVKTDFKIIPGQYCIAIPGGKVKPVDKEDLTFSDFLNVVGICYEATDDIQKTCVVKV